MDLIARVMLKVSNATALLEQTLKAEISGEIAAIRAEFSESMKEMNDELHRMHEQKDSFEKRMENEKNEWQALVADLRAQLADYKTREESWLSEKESLQNKTRMVENRLSEVRADEESMESIKTNRGRKRKHSDSSSVIPVDPVIEYMSHSPSSSSNRGCFFNRIPYQMITVPEGRECDFIDSEENSSASNQTKRRRKMNKKGQSYLQLDELSGDDVSMEDDTRSTTVSTTRSYETSKSSKRAKSKGGSVVTQSKKKRSRKTEKAADVSGEDGKSDDESIPKIQVEFEEPTGDMPSVHRHPGPIE